jgi:hypothetical protein
LVHLTDDGVFDAPVEKIWRYLQDTTGHKHGSVRVAKVLEQSDKGMTAEFEVKNPDGSWMKETWKMAFNPPKGHSMEVTTGPRKGTKQTHTYTPMGDKTKVFVEGDFRIEGLDDAATKKAVLGYLEVVFNEDNALLRNYK